MRKLIEQFQGKRVFLTGHTGFKGSWLSELLLFAGAKVCGYALPPAENGLFRQLRLAERMEDVEGDIRNLTYLREAFLKFRPEFVFHLAAQPLVRESYRDPVGTYSTNVLGTVHLLECVRTCGSVKSVVNVTTDKVYENREWIWGYRENDLLNGFDPYANSKSCSELVTQTYVHSFLEKQCIAVSTARAGNVIGGGDFAKDRIIPDCIRAVRAGLPIHLRSPNSVRPYQHVLEPLTAYLMIAAAQYKDAAKAGAYNVGPSAENCLTTGELAELFCCCWGKGASWVAAPENGPHEAGFLRLDSSKIEMELGWHPRWNAETSVEKTVSWTKAVLSGQDAGDVTRSQIRSYFTELEERKHG